MKKIGAYLLTVLIITIFIPTVIVKTFNFVPKAVSVEGKGFEDKIISKKTSPEKKYNIKEEEVDYIKVFDPDTKMVNELTLDDYVKGVVAAEMPAEFHIEALKAQAIASRTYAISRSVKYNEGHPDHDNAPLCSGIHCQAYLSLNQLEQIHGTDWIEKYWGKIEEAVDSTKGLVIYYEGLIIEPLYHSTSGGMTEDAVDVFAVDSPYLKSVESPYEENAPRYRAVINLTAEEFIGKINKKFPDAKMTKDDFLEKIKLVEKTPSGRVKRLAINDNIVDGREIRDLFSLNSTNFKISYDKGLNLMEIETYGYGHGVGMSQWGANGMAKNGQDYQEILEHYYNGIEIIESDFN